MKATQQLHDLGQSLWLEEEVTNLKRGWDLFRVSLVLLCH